MRLSGIPKERRHTAQLIRAANKDSDPVSVFALGTCAADMDGAIIVVKGGERARAVTELLTRQGLVTPGKPVEG